MQPDSLPSNSALLRSCLPRAAGINPWSYDLALYRRRNEIERLFRRLKGFRRIFSRFEKPDVMFTAFIHFALITEALPPEALI